MRLIIQGMITLILSIAVHEFGHAIVAHKLGDRLPASQGRVTLNPVAHIDPIGTLLLPLIFLVYTGGQSIGFGWGKPVMVRPLSFSRRFSMRTGHMFVAAAGPAMNVIFGTIIAVIHVSLVGFGVIGKYDPMSVALVNAVGLNFILVFFNLIPAPPLDGGAVLEGLLPARLVPGFEKFKVYGPFVLMAVIFIDELRWFFVTPALWMLHTWYAVLGLSYWS